MDQPAPRAAPAPSGVRARRGTAARQPVGAPPGLGPVLVAVSVGGGLGAAARYGAGLLAPTPEGGLPWATLGVNAAGCAAMGVLMVLVTEVWTAAPRLLRPFLGTGVLGGFTTFSAFGQEVAGLLDTGRTPLALTYLTLTVTAALAAVWLATTATRAVARRCRR